MSPSATFPDALCERPRKPAFDAVVPGVTLRTTKPGWTGRPTPCSLRLATLNTLAPNFGRFTSPYWRSCGTTRFTVLIGTANPTPTEPPAGERICELIPIIFPYL